MTPRAVAENYWKIECQRDIEAILNCYEPNAELIVPGLGRLVGHDEIRTFYQASIDKFPGLKVEIVAGFEDGPKGAFEWRSEFKDHDGRTFRSKGANFIHISNARFLSVHVYFDPADLNIAVPGESA